MKKNLFYLFALICSMSLFTACSDDEEVPPTVEDVVAEYAGETLKLTVTGTEVATDEAKIEVVQTASADKVTLVLRNIVPGVEEFQVPDVEFAVITKSIYASTFKGEVADDLSGYLVKVEGTVDEKVLTATVNLTEIEGVIPNMTSYYKTAYKGNMNIVVSNIPDPVEMEQRVYFDKPYSRNMEQRDTAMVKLRIENFTFQEIELGTITVDTIPFVQRNEVYAFEATGRKIKVKDPIGEVVADLKGTVVGEALNLKLDIDALGLQVNVNFEGGNVVESRTVSMEEFSVESAAVAEQTLKGNTFTMSVWDDVADEDLLLTPKFKVSDNGKVEYILVHIDGQDDYKLSQEQAEGKEAIDFSVLKGEKDYIRYRLQAEDPNYGANFTVKMSRFSVEKFVFDMQEWAEDGTPEGLASSNGAAALLPIMGVTLPDPGKPVVKAEDGAARITTFKTIQKDGYNGGLIPVVTSGTLFLGEFSIDITNTLKSTKFGVPCKNKPSTFKFTYRYTPGDVLYKTEEKESGKFYAVPVEGQKDECSIAAYVYEVESYTETLDGTNINTSDKVILKAMLSDGTAKADYQDVTLNFEETGKGAWDASKKYKLAIVCTSSKWGDQFMGGDLSSLYVKSLAVE